MPLDLIIGTSISTGSLIIITALFLSSGLVRSFPLELLNLILLAFGLGIIASTLFFVLWHYFKNTKFIILLESYFLS